MSRPTISFVLADERALLSDSAAKPTKPAEASSVEQALARVSPGLRLVLRAEKHISTYSAWLWEGNDGQAYFSKEFSNGKTLAWKPGATIERALKKTRRSMTLVGTDTTQNAVQPLSEPSGSPFSLNPEFRSK